MNRLGSVLRLNQRPPKPRSRGLTEIRGPYYSVLGLRVLSDALDTMGAYVDSLKFAGGSFCLMPEERVRELIEVCHAHEVSVSTGGFLERALLMGADAVDQCLTACRSLGFDTIEVSAGFVSVPPDDLLALTMFEASDPNVFTWYVKNYGPDVNLFIDHSQIVQLEALRSGLWGTADIWGRVVRFALPSTDDG